VPLSAAYAADPDAQPALSGSIEAGVLHTNTDARDPSKANEYRDLGNGGIGSFEIKGRGDQYYIDVFGENINRDDQYLNLQGGKYGTFKYGLYENDLVHNLSNGSAPYSGIGGGYLNTGWTGLVPPKASTWTPLDFSLTRKDSGGFFEFTNNSPWYIRAGANQVNTTGLKPMGGAEQTSSPGRFMELAAPVDYRTNNFSVEGGYNSKKGMASFNFTQSNFANTYEFLQWQNPAITLGPNQALSSLAPDNNYTKFSANGVLRQLPFDSTFAARVNYGRLTDNVGVPSSYLNNTAVVSTGVTSPSNSNSSVFSGNTVRTDAALSLTSQLAPKLGSRLYFNYNRLANDSTPIVFAAQAVACDSGATCTPTLLEYKKNNLGLELNYRLTTDRKVSGGFDYLTANQNRMDYDRDISSKVYLEYKDNSPFATDWVSARIRYQYVDRRADNLLPNNIVLQGSNPINGAFDAASVNQNAVKLMLDADPKQFLNLGLEAAYKHDDYPANVYMGQTGDNRQELYLSAAYGDPSVFRFSLFADVEFIQTNASHRYTNSCAGTGCDATGIQTANSYNWTDTTNDRNWAVGLGADWPYREWLKFKASLMMEKTNSSADFTAAAMPASINNILPIPNYGSTLKQSFNLKGIYTYSKNIEFTGGYAFELMRVSDISYLGLQYPLITGANQDILTGAFANPNYTTNIVYLLGKYKF